jgi:hypothetical protein
LRWVGGCFRGFDGRLLVEENCEMGRIEVMKWKEWITRIRRE